MPYLSNIKEINPNITLPVSEDRYDLTKNSGYNQDSRQGSVNTKAANTNLDTSEYEARLKDYSDAFNQAQSDLWKAQQMGDWTAEMTGAKTRAIRDAQNRMNSAQSSMQQTNTDKSNYLSAQANRTNLDKATTASDQALASAQQNEQATASANRTANINAGINRSKAGMLGSAAASDTTANTAQNIYAGNRSAQASTQADYLEKMAQADALDQQAGNIKKSQGLTDMAAFFNGAGAGASTGASLANSSDENTKEAPTNKDEDRELLDMVKQFRTLYKELKMLKGEK